MRIASIIGFMLLGSTAAQAGSEVDRQIKRSFLVPSAFECAVVSPNDKERERLFMLGLKAGRDFIRFVQDNTDLYRKNMSDHVPMLWNLIRGPTPDFILGRVYADREREIYKEFSSDDALWNIKKRNMYDAKNCALLGEK